MNQTIKLNVIPFDVPVEEVEFAFYKTNPNNFCRIHKDDLNGLLEDIIDESELHEGKWLYTDFQPAKENTINININLYDNVYFSLHYYRYLIRNYFSGKAEISIRLSLWQKPQVQTSERDSSPKKLKSISTTNS